MESSTQKLASQLPQTPTVQNAVKFAVHAHGGQTRRSSDEPYVNHVLRVARLVHDTGAPEEVIIAAILHDTVEDTDVTMEDIQQKFGNIVTGYVDTLTEDDKSAAWEDRKAEAQMKLMNASKEAMLIKAADKIDNISSIISFAQTHPDTDPWKFFNRGKEKKIPVWEKTYTLFEERYPECPLLDTFRSVLDEVKTV